MTPDRRPLPSPAPHWPKGPILIAALGLMMVLTIAWAVGVMFVLNESQHNRSALNRAEHTRQIGRLEGLIEEQGRRLDRLSERLDGGEAKPEGGQP